MWQTVDARADGSGKLLPVWGVPDEGAVQQMRTCMEHDDVVGAALMADHHLGYSMPIGGVIAYREHVSPSGVGYDIGCGNKAVRLDLSGAWLRPRIRTVMDLLWADLSFGIGRKNAHRVDSPMMDSSTWDSHPVARPLKDLAAAQLGTIGSGNHFVDLFTDELDRVWVGVHFGSRGLGHKLASYYIAAGGGKDGMHVAPVVLHQESDLGQEYLQAMHLAGEYAAAGRSWVCERVAEVLGAAVVEEVHNHHNFAWWEDHGVDCWVIRKGATPAFPCQRGFVGGTMGETSVILEGLPQERSTAGHAEASFALWSTVHGAGRVMGRAEAAGKWKGRGRDRVLVRPGKVTRAMMDGWLQDAGGVELRGAGEDEAPQCYKRLGQVLAAHQNTVRVLHTLTPVGVAMAGKDEHDPYKD